MRLLLNAEFLRRLAIAIGLFVSILMYMTTIGESYMVLKPDFTLMKQAYLEKKAERVRAYEKKYHSEQERCGDRKMFVKYLNGMRNELEAKKTALEAERNEPLEQYITAVVSVKSKEVSGPEWQSLIWLIDEYYQGRTPKQWLDNTAETKNGYPSLIFPDKTEPFASVRSGVRIYYLVYSDGGTKQYLKIYNFPPDLAEKYIPDSFLHPWRAYFWLPFALGLALYLLIPRVKRPEGAIGYTKLWGLIITDFFVLLFSGLFFLFGCGLLSLHDANILTFSSMDSGYQISVVVFWIIAVLILGAMWPCVSRRNFWITLLPDGLERHTVSGATYYAYADMKQAGLTIKDYGWMVRLILALSSFGNAGTYAMGLSLGARDNRAAFVRMEMQDGKSWQIRPAELEGGVEVIKALRDGRVVLDGELNKVLKDLDEEEVA